ncbi:MAG: TlpA family protein disulfide reductase [Thermoanaerobaculia bacterium]
MFLSIASVAGAADLRDVKDPAALATMFPASARLRLVNVWATWCVPCVEEMPVLGAIHKTFGSDVAMLGVTLDDMIPGDRAETRKKVRAFLEAKQITFPNAYYTGNSDALGERLGIDGAIPITIIYDNNGKELWRLQGTLEREQTLEKIRSLLRRK